MEETQSPAGPVTLVISEVIDPSQAATYEAWTKGINREARQFDGFLGVDIIRPRDHDYPEYVVIVKFDTYEHLRRWIRSPTYRAWMAQSHGLIAARSQQHLPSGLEIWFTLPNSHTDLRSPLSSPPYYKQVILGVLAVYPLILLANGLLGSLLGGLHPLVSLFISVIFVSALLTYPVMPWLSKGLEFWLYPKARRP
ncbi:antibiotic biosynthesis monooxygenase [Nodosilinea sp. E11]|uniref:antibiotic biosynthesis monooxygenase n=1 Tax=Nodosilinea sp. E11 TaxID=3037479 RepID=UPI002934F442|nr:antibiotic biosynthesis monooxygenase [Nodosilinea sp. E11]WOD41428.1 antibiotic biosynthesis monooxygenase [Nodosilinea sp. E11]